MYSKTKLHETIQAQVLNCMKSTDIKDIRLEPILKAAGISKATFYRNYRSIDDVVKEMEAEFLSGLKMINEMFPEEWVLSPATFRRNCYEIADYLDSKRSFLKVINGPHGDPQFLYKHSRVLIERISSSIKTKNPSRRHKDLYIQFLVDGTNSVLDNWIENRPDIPPEEIAELMEELFLMVLS